MPMLTGQVGITGTAQRLTSAALTPSAFTLKARSSNSGPVFIGPAGVTPATGHALEPGETLEYERGFREFQGAYDLVPGDFYVVGTNGDVVTWLAFQ